MPKPIAVLLVDKHAAFRQPLAFLFQRKHHFTVVGQAGSLAEAREKLNGVDLALIELRCACHCRLPLPARSPCP